MTEIEAEGSSPRVVLAEVVRRFRAHSGLRAKSKLRVVREVLGQSDWVHGPGDDTATLEDGDTFLLLAGEAIWPPFIESDPFGAGAAAVVANVNDVAAMGGRPLALVDTVVASEQTARSVLEGMRFASELYDVPILGGHLTVVDRPPAVSAFVSGRSSAPLASRNVAAGQVLMLACCLEGRFREDFSFFGSLRQRGERLAADIRVLPEIAESGECVAAKDVSMAGFLGSLTMLLEPTGCGALIELDRLPRPEGVELPTWLSAFPTYAFFLCAPPERVASCGDRFRERGLECAPVGVIDSTGRLRARLAGEEAMLADVARDRVTHLGSR